MNDPVQPTAKPSIIFVTGVDSRMFGQLCLLLGSVCRNSPSVWLHVCDLGLTEPQRAYLRRSKRLLERPAGRPLRHAWYGKAALGDYTDCLNADFVVWLDADLIILNDIVPLVHRLCAEMQAKDQIIAAAGSDALPLGDLSLDQAPGFRRAMTALDLKSPYLNSGFVICRSREFLVRWAALCDGLPYELLFEQNAFNLAAYEQPKRIHLLDPWVWNLCGTAFRSAHIMPNGQGLAVIGHSGRVNILHATSSERAKDLCVCYLPVKVNDRLFRPRFKIITCFEALVNYQFRLVIEFITAEAPALIACGLGQGSPHPSEGT
jgi:hypothetical protein